MHIYLGISFASLFGSLLGQKTSCALDTEIPLRKQLIDNCP